MSYNQIASCGLRSDDDRSKYELSHVYFADRARCLAALLVVPRVRSVTAQFDARLPVLAVVGLARAPAAVPHHGHPVAVGVRGRHAPDEPGLGGRVDTLTSRPVPQKPSIIVLVARTQRRL